VVVAVVVVAVVVVVVVAGAVKTLNPPSDLFQPAQP
jgi:hypothetical protein